jgi:hypothetical protein
MGHESADGKSIIGNKSEDGMENYSIMGHE